MTAITIPTTGMSLGCAGLPAIVARPANRLTIARIQEEVARYFSIPLSEMTSARRSRDVARPRQIAMFLARELTPKSLPDIGRRFGGRDHTTVMHAIRVVEALLFDDHEIGEATDYLRSRLA